MNREQIRKIFIKVKRFFPKKKKKKTEYIVFKKTNV